MKITATINDASLRAYVWCRDILPYVALGFCLYMVMTNMAHADGGVNHLSGMKDDVKATFGKGSDTQYFILLAEGLGGAYAYMKTKNIAMLCGVPLLMVFTHWALK